MERLVSGSRRATLQFAARAGVDYVIAVDGYGGRTGEFSFTYELVRSDRVIPVVLTSERDRSLKEGDRLLVVAEVKLALAEFELPMGAFAPSRAIHDSVVNNAPDGIELFHGYTYSGHPLAAAAGIATLDVYEEERLFDRAIELEDYWADAIHSLKGTRHVIDCRNVGLIGGIELEPRPGAPTARALEAFKKCFDAGVLIRVTGDIIAFSPPLMVPSWSAAARPGRRHAHR